MYTAIFSLGGALVAGAGMMYYGISAPMAGGGFVAAMAVGMAIDVMRSKFRTAVK